MPPVVRPLGVLSSSDSLLFPTPGRMTVVLDSTLMLMRKGSEMEMEMESSEFSMA